MVDYYPLKVIKKEWETKNSCSFYFEVDKNFRDLFEYKTAQFLSFRFKIKGKEYVRSYSLSSSPFREETLRTTVGRVGDGVVSNYMLDQIKEGDTIQSQVPLGEFFKLPSSFSAKPFVLFAAGIGITPIFSILKTLLETGMGSKIKLLFSIRKEEEFIYEKEIRDLEKKHSNFSLNLIVSKKEGRLDKERIKKEMEEISKKEAQAYLCGPKEYMKMIRECLLDLSFKKEQIHKEDFKVIPITYPTPDDQSVFFEKEAEEGEPKNLKARFDSEDVKIPLNREKALLEQLIDQGHQPPFSCLSGNCMTCMAKLKKGKVFMLEEGILDEENIKNLEILTCISYPLSPEVEIDYEDL